MKHNKNHDHVSNVGAPLVPVRFAFTAPQARTVSVGGCFNHWQPEAKTLHPAGGGRWVKETVLLPGTYDYRLIADGPGMATPSATESMPNSFGGRNSLWTVLSPEAPGRPRPKIYP